MNTQMRKTGAAALVAAFGLMLAGTAGAAETHSGREVFERFRAGLAEPACPAQPSRWTRQFAHAPDQLSRGNDQTLVLFSHVVESVRAAHLPSEYALIPFVESGYKPNARSAAGPAGLWQFIASTARNHKVPMRPGYDGRMSPVDSTKAAVRYLKTLHGMFGGNWRLAVMAYNSGEYRVLGALKRAGQTPRNGRPESLTGLSGITHAYDDKLHAISCVMAQADRQPRFLASLDRPIRALGPVTSSGAMVAMETPKRAPSIIGAATSLLASGSAAAALGTGAASDSALAPAAAEAPTISAPSAPALPAAPATALATGFTPRRHTVAVGESLWIIARRYRVSVGDLLSRNGLKAGKLIAPGMVLAVDTLASK